MGSSEAGGGGRKEKKEQFETEIESGTEQRRQAEVTELRRGGGREERKRENQCSFPPELRLGSLHGKASHKFLENVVKQE